MLLLSLLIAGVRVLVHGLLVPVLLWNQVPACQLVSMGLIAAEVAAPLMAVTGVGIAVGRLMEARQVRAVRGAMLRAGACPMCAYSLRELEPDVDGVTTCAECGGAWVVPQEEGEAAAEIPEGALVATV